MDRELVNRQIDDVLKSSGALPEVSSSYARVVRIANEVIPEIFENLLDKVDGCERTDLLYALYMVYERRVAVGVPLTDDNRLSIKERMYVTSVPDDDGRSEVHIYFSESLLASYDSIDDKQAILDRFKQVALDTRELCTRLIMFGEFKPATQGIWRGMNE